MRARRNALIPPFRIAKKAAPRLPSRSLLKSFITKEFQKPFATGTEVTILLTRTGDELCH